MYTKDQNSTRTRLLEGALTCLREKGYEGTTARDIAAASGANLRSIGYHFGSTKGLLLEAISLNFREWLRPLIEMADDVAESPVGRIRRGAQRFVESLPENGPVLRAWLEAVVLAGREEALGSTLASNQAEFRSKLEATLAEAGTSRPVAEAAAIVAVCDGLIIRFLLHGEVGDPELVAADAARALAGG